MGAMVPRQMYTWQARAAIWAMSVVLYLGVFVAFVDRLGAGIAPISVLPVLFAGWFFGMRAGVAAALLFIPANLVMLAVAGVADGLSGVTSPGSFALFIVGLGAGRIRDLGQLVAVRAADDAKQQKMREILSSAPLFIAVTVGPEHRLAYFNHYIDGALRGRNIDGSTAASLLASADAALTTSMDDVYRTGLPYTASGVRMTALSDGGTRFMDIRIAPSRDADGRIEGLILFFTDVTETLQARLASDARVRQQAVIASLGQHALAGWSVDALMTEAADLSGRILDAETIELLVDGAGTEPPRIGALFGTRGDPTGAPDADRTMRLPIRGLHAAFGAVVAAARPGQPFGTDERFFLEAVARVVAGAMDRDVAGAALAQQSLHDDLTGLPNRRLLQDRLDQALLASRRRGTETALLMVDLNAFKLVNDAHGHAVGDHLLEQVGDRFRKTLRESDTVARLGGDEFAIVLSEITGMSDVSFYAGRLTGALAEPFIIDGHSLRISASVGAVIAPQDGDDVSTLMRRADISMYGAKRAHEDFRQFTPDQDHDASERLALAHDLRNALAQRTLTLAYQPQIDFATGRVIGVEALARWRHPRLGPIAPDRFVAAAEENGFVHELTRWVLDEVATQGGRWRAAGHPLNIAINVSMLDLKGGALVAQIDDLVRVGKLGRGELTLEITESAAGDMETISRTLRDLHASGVQLSIDDYGTGYSSLQHVGRLAVQEVKIDRSFIAEVLTNPASRAIVGSTIDLAHRLGLRVVAEGVETQDVWSYLRQLRCDVAQGYFIARPLTVSEIDAWLSQRPLAA